MSLGWFFFLLLLAFFWLAVILHTQTHAVLNGLFKMMIPTNQPTIRHNETEQYLVKNFGIPSESNTPKAITINEKRIIDINTNFYRNNVDGNYKYTALAHTPQHTEDPESAV